MKSIVKPGFHDASEGAVIDPLGYTSPELSSCSSGPLSTSAAIRLYGRAMVTPLDVSCQTAFASALNLSRSCFVPWSIPTLPRFRL